MSEKEQFLAMLERAGVPYETHASEKKPGNTVIHIIAADGTGEGIVHGYWDFYCMWEFDGAGNLVSIGIYE